jgi:glycosyltransferase involved in cell wall biosynthesis
MNTKILFFVDSFSSGGKERRILELLSYLQNKNDYDLRVVLTDKTIHYDMFYELNIPYTIIEMKTNKNPLRFYHIYKICQKYKPDIIHSWRMMNSFYSIPCTLLLRIPLINNQITDANIDLKKLSFKKNINRINFFFSRYIIANSYAGLHAYGAGGAKSLVIYNGVNLNRFTSVKKQAKSIKAKYNINTKFTVIMVASYSNRKNYKLFIDTAYNVNSKNSDVTFVGIGGIDSDESEYKRIIKQSSPENRILLLGKVKDVESLVNACDVGVLFSNNVAHGEGISNSIIEYMALGKPVIANDSGGTKEIVENNRNGYLVENETVEEISAKILELIEDDGKRYIMGKSGKDSIFSSFTISKMGKSFEAVYSKVTQRN